MSEGWAGPPAQQAPQQQYPQAQGGWGPNPMQPAPQQQWPQQPPQAPQGGQWGAPPAQQQQGWPGQQQAPQQPIVEPPPAEDFFTGGGGGNFGPYAPSFKFDWDAQQQRGSGVQGEVVWRGQTPKTDTGSTVQKLDSLGRPRWQLKVVLQTAFRGWAGVAKIPTDKQANGQEVERPADQDTGLRAIYLDYKSRDAVQGAMEVAGADLTRGVEVGATIGLRVIGTEKNTKGPQPIKLYDALYTPPGAPPQQQVAAAQPAAVHPGQPQQPQYAPQQPQYQQGPPPGQPQQGYYQGEPPF